MTLEGNIGAENTTLLQKLKQSLSHEHKVSIKVEHKPIKEFKGFMEMTV